MAGAFVRRRLDMRSDFYDLCPVPDPDNYLHALPFPDGEPAPRPEQFNYPFHYVPHPLAIAAAEDLQRHLQTQTDWEHDFGLTGEAVGGRGKMFGVLVVDDPEGNTGYLAAYSGKLADSNDLPGFVPPVYDTLRKEGFYKIGEERLTIINARVKQLVASDELAAAREAFTYAEKQSVLEISRERKAQKAAKAARDHRRAAQRAVLSVSDFTLLEKELAEESVGRHFDLKDLTRAWTARVENARNELAALTGEIDRLKELRRAYSNHLQRRIFRQYRFLDANGKFRDLPDIFEETIFKVPPAGAGECAAPKLLQYAYQKGYQPVAMAEFWWGQSPKSAIRRHGDYYPACRGKCEPILGHMLVGLDVEPNPLLNNPAAGKTLDIVYEDDVMLVVNKPAEFLSVPGRTIEDSVSLRMQQRYPEATGPMLVHRLDMSTSGILLLTKTKDTHKLLQQQFFKRSVRKRYVALLKGRVEGEEGFIDLPLRGDIEDRPRQIVCYEHGKGSRTRWKVMERKDGVTRVHLWPVTGRTHQLRVHCAHALGLNASIVGDDLYGQPAERLCLHAEEIAFIHPVTREEISIVIPAEF